jgi:hypothetical protein
LRAERSPYSGDSIACTKRIVIMETGKAIALVRFTQLWCDQNDAVAPSSRVDVQA